MLFHSVSIGSESRKTAGLKRVIVGGCPWVAGSGFIDLKVRLTPKSSADVFEGVARFGEEFVLKARVRAIPAGGAANRALEILCAKWLSVPKSSVAVSSGPKSRIKTLRLTGDPIELESRINERLALK